MKKILVLLMLVLPLCTLAQFVDDFTDGDFTAAPVWSGDAAVFIVNASFQLQLNNAAIAATSYLSAPNTLASLDNMEWRFYIKQTFSPSSSNFGRVYLVSDQANLTGSLNGYYLQFGEALSLDAVELFKQTGMTSTSVCRGTDAQIANSFTLGIRVTRDAAGLWTLYVDGSGGTTYVLESSGTDLTYTTSAFLGVLCTYTASNSTKFFFDDFNIGAMSVDVTPPTISSATVISSTQLDVKFSEPIEQSTAETVTNYSVDNGIGNPSLAVRDGADNSLVHLTFATTFANGVLNTITINNLKDNSNNVIAANSDTTFTFFTTVAAGFKDVLINEIFADINPQVALPVAEFTELYNRSASAIDLNGWTFTDGSSTSTFPTKILSPGAYLIICSTANAALFSSYGDVQGLPSFPALNDAGDHLQLFDASSLLIDDVSYNTTWYHDAAKQNGGWSLELINPSAAVNCTDASNWIASNDVRGGTPGTQNSVFSSAVDTTQPAIASVQALDSITLQICFSKGMNPALLGVVANYFVDQSIGNPATVTVDASNLCVTLTFSSPFVPVQLYTVTVSNLTDCSGNTLADSTATFNFFVTVPASFKDILINEILADVSPVIGLPSAEYVELHNRSGNAIDLAGWTFSDGGTTPATFGAGILFPDSFLIICSTTNATLFSGYGNVMGLTSFPSLNDGGDHLKLFDASSLLIDDVNYLPTWCNDAVKQNGGWSLELINPNTALGCTDATNWIASNDVSGGTPGTQNSVYSSAVDTSRPSVISAVAIASDSLQVCFNESINPDLFVAGNFSVDNSIGIASNIIVDASLSCVTLFFSTTFSTGITYTVTCSLLSDCSGNRLLDSTQQFSYVIPDTAAQYDIIINEIMYEPASGRTLPNEEWIELYNRSNKNIDLSGWTITDGGTTAIFGNTLLTPGSYLIVAGPTAAPQFTSYGTAIGLTSFPSLNNDVGDDLKLIDNTSNVIDEVRFDDSYYHDAFKDGGGWSIERVDKNFVCSASLNWKATTDASGGTPGRANSVAGNFTDNISPQAIRTCLLDSTHVIVYFDEQIPDSVLADTNRYFISSTDILLGNPTTATSSADFSSVTLQLPVPIIGGIGTVTVSSTFRDCAGNFISQTSDEVNFGFPSSIDSGDVVLNEILFHAGTNGNEFVELYNRSSKTINLNELYITRRDLTTHIMDTPENLTADCYQLLPGGYVVLTDKPDVVIEQYPNSVAKNFLAMNLPSMTDDSDNVVLLSPTFKILDELFYYQTWQFPLLNNLAGVSLERLSPNRKTQEQTNWHSAAQTVGFATPGYKNSQFDDGMGSGDEISVEPEIFSPDEDGKDDNINIHFHFATAGNVANASIYDSKGRLTRTLITQELLGTDGTFSWDGVTNDKEKARMGIYIFFIELFDEKGNVRDYKRTCVLASRL